MGYTLRKVKMKKTSHPDLKAMPMPKFKGYINLQMKMLPGTTRNQFNFLLETFAEVLRQHRSNIEIEHLYREVLMRGTQNMGFSFIKSKERSKLEYLWQKMTFLPHTEHIKIHHAWHVIFSILFSDFERSEPRLKGVDYKKTVFDELPL